MAGYTGRRERPESSDSPAEANFAGLEAAHFENLLARLKSGLLLAQGVLKFFAACEHLDVVGISPNPVAREAAQIAGISIFRCLIWSKSGPGRANNNPVIPDQVDPSRGFAGSPLR